MYKDKDKQREANRDRLRRYRAKQKALPNQGVTEGVTKTEYLEVSDQDFVRLLATVPPGTPNIRVSKPGDSDYVSICETTRRYINGQG